jgi:hypothetical protein
MHARNYHTAKAAHALRAVRGLRAPNLFPQLLLGASSVLLILEYGAGSG